MWYRSSGFTQPLKLGWRFSFCYRLDHRRGIRGIVRRANEGGKLMGSKGQTLSTAWTLPL